MMSLLRKIISAIRDALLLNYYSKYFKDINKYKSGIIDPNTKNMNVLMYVAIPDMYLTPLEILLYHMLRKKGANVDYYVYDKSIEYHELITSRTSSPLKLVKRIVSRGNKMLRAAGVDYGNISVDKKAVDIAESLKTYDEIIAYEKDGIEFSEIIEGTLNRYYKSRSHGNNKYEVAKSILITSLTNYFKIKSLCAIKSYDYVLFSHGIYCSWEILPMYLKANGIKYLSYDRAKTKDHININLNMPSPVWDISHAWSRYDSYKLDEKEIDKVDNYLIDRESQQGDVYSYNPVKRTKDIDALKYRLGIPLDHKIITIFTNLIWDAANVSRDIAFSSPLDCIKQTIDHYGMKNNVTIVVRTHPAETVLGTNESYADLVSDYVKGKGYNLIILDSSIEVNSFSVIEFSDVGIVHTSTVGLEMAMLGKPVVLISETHYRGKGFTYDVSSSSEYFSAIDNILIESKPLPKQVMLAKKYFYLMMFEYQQRVPLIRSKHGQFKRYRYSSVSSIIESQDENVTMIVNRIMSEEKYHDFIFMK